jgi:hypothetical protein
MCLEFLDVRLRPFATDCFTVFLCLCNFQLVSSLFDGAALLTHRRAGTTKQRRAVRIQIGEGVPCTDIAKPSKVRDDLDPGLEDR